jgi:hypothetical protein
MPLEHLFDAELEYRDGMAPLSDSGEGELIGSGDGSVEGERLRGRLRWTLFEGQDGGGLTCTMQPTLVIDTDDGDTIAIEGRGYAHRTTRADQLWHVAATLLFSTNSERYAWLDGALGVWEGGFDAERHSARYRAFVQTPAHNGAATSTAV